MDFKEYFQDEELEENNEYIEIKNDNKHDITFCPTKNKSFEKIYIFLILTEIYYNSVLFYIANFTNTSKEPPCSPKI